MWTKWSNFSSRIIGMRVRQRRLSMLVKLKMKWTKSRCEGQLHRMVWTNRFRQMILTMTTVKKMASGAHLSNIRNKWSPDPMRELAFLGWHLLKCTPCNNDNHLCRTEWWVRRPWHGRVWVQGDGTASSTADHPYLLSLTRTWRMHKIQAVVLLVKIHNLRLKEWCLVCLAVCGLLSPLFSDGAVIEMMMKSLISNVPALIPSKDSEMTSKTITESCQMELRHL